MMDILSTNSGRGAHDYDTAFVAQRRAVADEIDANGHVNNTVYVKWIEDIALGHWFSLVPEEQSQRDVWVCRRHEIDYLGEIKEGDLVEVRTWFGAWKGARFDRHVDIRLAGAPKPATVARTEWVLIDRASMRPKRISKDVLALVGLSDHGTPNAGGA